MIGWLMKRKTAFELLAAYYQFCRTFP